VPALPPAAAETLKTALEKARAFAAEIVQAYESSPDVDAPLFGQGSGAFSLLSHYDNLKLKGISEMGVMALKRTACASFGWKASAAGPEKIFSYAGLLCSALKSRYSIEMLERMVFLKKNAKFMPSVEEVVAELTRRKAAATVVRRQNRAAAKAEKASKAKASSLSSSAAASSNSSSPSGNAPVTPSQSDAEASDSDDGDAPDISAELDASPELSEEEVESLLTEIADFRGGADGDGQDEWLLQFIRELDGVPVHSED
jgi:hypothetical protein